MRAWTSFQRAVTRARNVIQGPGDALLALSIGAFLVRAPAELEAQDLRGYLELLRHRPRPRAPDLVGGTARVTRIRDAWLRAPGLRRRDSCYVRALTLYRFLDAGDRDVRLHVGVESAPGPDGRLHGHAWVTVDGEVLEGPPEYVMARIREMPIHADGDVRRREKAAESGSLEWDLLLACVGNWPGADVASLVDCGPDWEQLVRLATWNRLSALLRAGLREAGVFDRAPESVRRQLTSAYHNNVATEAARRRHLDEVLGRFGDEGIPAMLLKGAALAETVYREPGLRPMADVDILVPEADVRRAHDALLECGYVLLPAHCEDEHHHLPGLGTPDGLAAFELHRSLMPPRFPLQLDADRFWRRGRPVDYAASHVLPAPDDLLVHVCVHFAQDRVRESEGALAQLCDIARLVGGAEIDWSQVCLFETPGIRAAVFLALVSAARLLRADIPDEVISRLRSPDADALVDRFIDERILRHGHRTGLALTQLHPSSVRTLLQPAAEPARASSRAERAGFLTRGAVTGIHRTVRSIGRAGRRDLVLDRQLLALYSFGDVPGRRRDRVRA
jgi:hypothetical protein